MKKLVYISGAAAVLTLILMFSGWANADSEVNRALFRGNERYDSADYKIALAEYEKGLETDLDNKFLCFNAAQAAYLLEDYQKAAEYYENSEDRVEKYLNAGNIFFKAGSTIEDAKEKVQCYTAALELYGEGIVKYPQDIPLKYNYETVKALLEELTNQAEQENQEDTEKDSEDSTESQEGEENQESQENQENQENQEGEEGEASEESESGEESEDPDREAVERILAMLESLEEESLKNNKEVAGGKDGGNGW